MGYKSYKGLSFTTTELRHLLKENDTKALRMAQSFFFIEVGILTKILDAINSFDKLLDTEYIFVLGRKNKSIELHIYFEKSHFYHLAGFQYLTDIANLHVNREKVYNNIKSGNIKPELLTSSVHYGEISCTA